MTMEDEESHQEQDELPDHLNHESHRPSQFHLMQVSCGEFTKSISPLPGRKHSLLTQALLTSPETSSSAKSNTPPMSRAKSTASFNSISGASTAELTSDGGLNSPTRTNTPSPPLPPTRLIGLGLLPHDGIDISEPLNAHDPHPLPPVSQAMAKSNTVTVEEPLARKRCITFACGENRPNQVKAPEHQFVADPPKRPCMLRFACPSKPSTPVIEVDRKVKTRARSPAPVPGTTSMERAHRHRDSDLTIKDAASPGEHFIKMTLKQSIPDTYAAHDFALAQEGGDAWLNEKPRAGHKITVTDTLRKENAIRKLGQEAEEEAIEEDLADDDDDAEGDEGSDTDFEDYKAASDDGNESDDEEGFADSDDDTEADPEYEFWTHGRTTAATSADHLDHIRSRSSRRTSVSSSESLLSPKAVAISSAAVARRIPRKRQHSPKMRPGTPELPDSTDFVCGTLDEDRPLEAAYLSCLEQRKLAKHRIVPQDLDPSFPTSDPDDEDDDDRASSDGPVWVTGRPDDSDSGKPRGRGPTASRKAAGSPAPSPRRLRSPPPFKRVSGHKTPPVVVSKHAYHSPPPRKLFGQTPRRIPSPAPLFRDSKPLPSNSTSPQRRVQIDIPYLAQRVRLTHTKSLPRTPNPFWHEHRRGLNKAGKASQYRRSDGDTEGHSRGPIDIVQGLETKRLRRREKFWRQHCRHVTKEKDRRCQPGKGAERMRELGLEMAIRCKAYGQRGQVVLSI